MRRVSPYALLSIAAATVTGALLAAPLSPADRILVAAVVAAGGIIAVRLPHEDRWLRASLAAALVCSFVYAHERAVYRTSIIPTRTERFTADVLDRRGCEETICTYVLRMGSIRVLAELAPSAPPGGTIVVRGRLEPLDESRNPGEPSERDLEAEHGISGRIGSASLLSILSTRPHSLETLIAFAHARGLELLRERLPEPGASIVAGELWGDRSSLPPDVRAEFQETGTVHVLVTAGLHVGLIAWLVLMLCERMTLPRALSCLLAVAVVWAFAAFSGANIPAIRAATMASVFLLARACGRATFSWSALAAASIVVIIIDPATSATPSFWLSFCCVGAILTCAPVLEPLLAPFPLHERVREAFILTVATQLGTWPITAATFLQFSTYAVLGNLAVVPLVPITMIVGLTQLVLTPIGPLAQAAANLNASLLAWDVAAARLLSTLPFAKIPMTPAPTWVIGLYELAVVVAALLVATYRAWTPALAALLIGTALVLYPPQWIDRSLRITVLDVGQADAIVIRTPAHHAILVDAGGRLERGPQNGDSAAERVGERIVVPFLLRQGIHQLDALIISHPHGDHVAGCAPVLRSIRVAEIADSGQTYGGHAYHDCLDTAAADHVPVVYPRARNVWRTYDGVMVTFIGPSVPFIRGKNAINDNSIAFVLTYRSFTMMFTGDAGVAAEQRFLDEGVQLHADVLKVGHHGSAYSSSPGFLAAVHPRCAVISVGRHNLFGHPASSTIKRMERSAITIYRTDNNGSVTITSDGSAILANCDSGLRTAI